MEGEAATQLSAKTIMHGMLMTHTHGEDRRQRQQQRHDDWGCRGCGRQQLRDISKCYASCDENSKHPPIDEGGGEAHSNYAPSNDAENAPPDAAHAPENEREQGLPHMDASRGSSAHICGHAPREHRMCGPVSRPTGAHNENTTLPA